MLGPKKSEHPMDIVQKNPKKVVFTYGPFDAERKKIWGNDYRQWNKRKILIKMHIFTFVQDLNSSAKKPFQSHQKNVISRENRRSAAYKGPTLYIYNRIEALWNENFVGFYLLFVGKRYEHAVFCKLLLIYPWLKLGGSDFSITYGFFWKWSDLGVVGAFFEKITRNRPFYVPQIMKNGRILIKIAGKVGIMVFFKNQLGFLLLHH